jgi:hypothetical protein
VVVAEQQKIVDSQRFTAVFLFIFGKQSHIFTTQQIIYYFLGGVNNLEH